MRIEAKCARGERGVTKNRWKSVPRLESRLAGRTRDGVIKVGVKKIRAGKGDGGWLKKACYLPEKVCEKASKRARL